MGLLFFPVMDGAPEIVMNMGMGDKSPQGLNRCLKIITVKKGGHIKMTEVQVDFDIGAIDTDHLVFQFLREFLVGLWALVRIGPGMANLNFGKDLMCKFKGGQKHIRMETVIFFIHEVNQVGGMDGIKKEDLEKIFELFYTSKKMCKSVTGLNMSVVWGTVRDHNGYIVVSSEPGRGTAVNIYFPVCRQGIDLAGKDIPDEDLMGQGQSILIVDDVPDQLEIASNYLRKLNYRVHTSQTGEQALEHMKYKSADLLVLDMIMEPGMDGLET